MRSIRLRLMWLTSTAVVVALTGCGSSTTGTAQAPSASTEPTQASSPSASPAPSTSPAPSASPTTASAQVWFLDEEHARTGEQPLFVPVRRQVRPPAVAAGALDALFAGPTAAERKDGLRLITSGADGYRNLHIADGIAQVTLTGGCSSGGSTMTIAGEIMPTLKQFSSVTFVKIYAPDGTTEQPAGAVDSVPTCLEP